MIENKIRHLTWAFIVGSCTAGGQAQGFPDSDAIPPLVQSISQSQLLGRNIEDVGRIRPNMSAVAIRTGSPEHWNLYMEKISSPFPARVYYEFSKHSQLLTAIRVQPEIKLDQAELRKAASLMDINFGQNRFKHNEPVWEISGYQASLSESGILIAKEDWSAAHSHAIVWGLGLWLFIGVILFVVSLFYNHRCFYAGLSLSKYLEQNHSSHFYPADFHGNIRLFATGYYSGNRWERLCYGDSILGFMTNDEDFGDLQLRGMKKKLQGLIKRRIVAKDISYTWLFMPPLLCVVFSVLINFGS
jgi:hypothetical protein